MRPDEIIFLTTMSHFGAIVFHLPITCIRPGAYIAKDDKLFWKKISYQMPFGHITLSEGKDKIV